MPADRNGMRTFLVVWAGQLVSVVGSGLTSFALGIWTYVETGSVTPFAMVTLAFTLPGILVAPFAGALTDRVNRRVVMLLADFTAGVTTVAIAVLFFTSGLELWHIYLNAAIASVAGAFQEPAYMAALPMLVDKEQLSRANGMVQLGQALGTLVSPALAGVLLVSGGLGVVMLIDVVTFAVAVLTLLVVRFPPLQRPEPADDSPSLIAEALDGWRYLRSKPGMMALLYVFAAVNFLLSIVTVLYLPMVLSFTTERTVGFVISAAGLGMLAGSLLMTAWVGPLSKVKGLVWSIVGGGLFVIWTGTSASPVVVGIGAFGLMALVPIANASSQVLWQTKIPLALQGRIFSVRRVFAQIATPLSFVLAGPLADWIFEPLLAEDGPLAGSVGRLIGVGPGRGIGFLFMLLGLGLVLLGVLAFAYGPIRNLERNHPDVIDTDAIGPAHPGQVATS